MFYLQIRGGVWEFGAEVSELGQEPGPNQMN